MAQSSSPPHGPGAPLREQRHWSTSEPPLQISCWEQQAARHASRLGSPAHGVPAGRQVRVGQTPAQQRTGSPGARSAHAVPVGILAQMGGGGGGGGGGASATTVCVALCLLAFLMQARFYLPDFFLQFLSGLWAETSANPSTPTAPPSSAPSATTGASIDQSAGKTVKACAVHGVDLQSRARIAAVRPGTRTAPSRQRRL